MLKKIFICVLMLAALIAAGCGPDKISGTPDKAILAFAEITMTGASENMAAAGFSADDQKEISRNMANTFEASMKNIAPLSDASAAELTKIYFDKLKSSMTFKATIKKEDSEHPIVEITTTPIDQGSSAKNAATENEELIALLGMVGQLKAEGAPDEQLKENPEVQKLAVAALAKYINNISFHPEESFDVTCTKMTGRDGNIHWAPLDNEAFLNFLTGKN